LIGVEKLKEMEKYTEQWKEVVVAARSLNGLY